MAQDNGSPTDRQTFGEALRTNEARLHAFIGSIDEVVFELDAKGIVLNVWTRDASLLTRPQSEIMGRQAAEALSREFASAFEAAFQRVLTTGQSENLEYPLDVIGGRKWFLARMNAIPALPGSAQTVCMLVRDITKHKREEDALRESEERYRALVDHSPTGVFVNVDNKFAYVNDAMCRLLGADSREQLIGTSVFDRFHPDFHVRIQERIQRIIQHGLTTPLMDQRYLRLDGSIVDVEAAASPIVFHGSPAAQVVVNDVTDRKRAEMKLKQTAERLSILLSTSRTLSSTLHLDGLLEHLLQCVVDAMPVADFGAIFFYDPQAQVLIPRVSIGGDPETLRHVRLQIGESISGRVFQLGQSILSRSPEENDVLKGPERVETARLFALARSGRRIHSNICVPLRSATGETIGTVALGSAHDTFNEDDLCLLEGIASQAAIAIQNAKLFDEVRAGRERLRVLSSQLITTQESERSHLARELHDEIGQVLTTIKMHLRSTQRSVDVPVQSYLEESITMVDRAIGQVRNLSLSLRPAQLDELGLVAALNWYVKQQARIAGFQEQFVVDPVELQVPPELATACFRITQEAVTNAVRHGQPHRIHVELRHCGDQLNLTIRDDGVGFDVQEGRQRASQGKSLGLLGMQERAQLSDGHLEIESRVGDGTTIRVQFPLPCS